MRIVVPSSRTVKVFITFGVGGSWKMMVLQADCSLGVADLLSVAGEEA